MIPWTDALWALTTSLALLAALGFYFEARELEKRLAKTAFLLDVMKAKIEEFEEFARSIRDWREERDEEEAERGNGPVLFGDEKEWDLVADFADRILQRGNRGPEL